ncbi:hypothetical protein SVIOM342S_09373 [Streptomyces violaceorubidus]
MDVKDSAVEMCTLLSMKNRPARSILSESTQSGGVPVTRRIFLATPGRPSGSSWPLVET